MKASALLTAVLEGVRCEPLGARLLPPLTDDEVTVAIEQLSATVWRDHELVRLHISDFDALSAYVTECSRSESPVTFSDEARLTLVVLSYLFSEMHERTTSDMRPVDGKPVIIPLGSDLATARKKLGEIKGKKRWGRLSEDCILNAAFGCSNPTVLIAAGRYYLSLIDADVPTALAYFINACDRDKAAMQACDKIVEEFTLERGHLYFGISLFKYLETWETYKGSHGGAKP